MQAIHTQSTTVHGMDECEDLQLATEIFYLYCRRPLGLLSLCLWHGAAEILWSGNGNFFKSVRACVCAAQALRRCAS